MQSHYDIKVFSLLAQSAILLLSVKTQTVNKCTGTIDTVSHVNDHPHNTTNILHFNLMCQALSHLSVRPQILHTIKLHNTVNMGVARLAQHKHTVTGKRTLFHSSRGKVLTVYTVRLHTRLEFSKIIQKVK